jgi:hypothetical protein
MGATRNMNDQWYRMRLASVVPFRVEGDRDEVVDKPIGPGYASNWDADGGLAGRPDWHIVGIRDQDGGHWLGWDPKNFRVPLLAQ